MATLCLQDPCCFHFGRFFLIKMTVWWLVTDGLCPWLPFCHLSRMWLPEDLLSHFPSDAFLPPHIFPLLVLFGMTLCLETSPLVQKPPSFHFPSLPPRLPIGFSVSLFPPCQFFSPTGLLLKQHGSQQVGKPFISLSRNQRCMLRSMLVSQ